MRKGSKAGYSLQTFHKDQLALLGNRACKDPKTTSGFLKDFFHDLNKTIIRDHYEWKIGSRGGYLRIAISRRGRIYWFWDKRTDYAQLPKKRLWDFKPVVGWQKPVEIGHRGLMKYIVECDKDNYKSRYKDQLTNKYPHRTFK